ncbi:MAG: threonine-phosphate decarboxylase CobD [Oscillatoria sp. PMC 1051.18]|nr:threonine-phosphate decarboxylase CobD [Oscillatoria sp. PMC 1050.18]MEC5028561.1 threonine-phosphate decarboxylase CobD [Oscillatoria sp. PMC 1051.18]
MNRPVHGGNLAWAAAVAGCSPSSIADFSASINPLGPPGSARKAIQNNLKLLSAYPDPDYSELRSALAEFHQLAPEWILPGNGAAELLTWACRELSQRERTFLLVPAFGDYERALLAFGAKVEKCLLDWRRNGRLVLTCQNVGEKPNRRAAGLLLNNPHNPTGQIWTVEAILAYLEEFDLVVIDEAFMDFLPPDRQQSLIPWLKKYRNLIIVRSLTKFYSLPGLRLGYAIAHPDFLQRWQQWRDPWTVNVLAAAVGAAVVKDTEFQRQTWDWLIPARAKLFQGLAAIEGLQPFPSAANFLLVETQQPSSQLQLKLLENCQILIRDCLSFPELGSRYFRVAIRDEAENQRLLTGLATTLNYGS